MLPQQVADTFLASNMSSFQALLIINAMLLVLHTALETASAIIVVVPVLLPLLSSLHIDPIQFGTILLVNSAIGINLPPIGFCLYIACSLTRVPLEKAAVAMIPFTVALLIDLSIVTLFPQVSLWLPSLLIK